MIAPHWRLDIAPVPESVSQSISTSSARSLKTLSRASSRQRSRSARVVMRIGSTLLMRNGSIRVLGISAPWGSSWGGAKLAPRKIPWCRFFRTSTKKSRVRCRGMPPRGGPSKFVERADKFPRRLRVVDEGEQVEVLGRDRAFLDQHLEE